MPYVAYQYATYVVITDQPVEEGYIASWPVPDPVAVQVIDEGANFEVVEGELVVHETGVVTEG